ncbi:amino acid permease [Trypanosoma theileri]|uniref:Amino acid permease n=1 Tax=Trypanosoma theileri TaxID=67003 RepID=A0A1X0NNQ0_9TRYP|nr:amino acid permease [Trypanosoma theileri]ORC86346.1 amino acid permease [Trypanosoma theileri]
MSAPVEPNFPTLVRRHHHTSPIFHPNLRRTHEVIQRPEWVRRAGEAVAHRGSVGVLALFGIMFASCLGGGYGFEDTVGAAGPLVTLIVGLLVPWIWSFPTGLAVAELSTAVPSNSGVLMWVNAAFPAYVSFMCIISTIFIIFIGNATFPNLTAEYVSDFASLSKGGQIGVKVGVVVLCCILNASGIEIVGSASIVVCFIALLPFLILSFQYIFTHGLDWKAISHVNVSDIDWGSFLSMVSWNYANVDNAGSMVEEVDNPRVTLPRMMIPLMFSSYVAYLLPMLAGVSALGPDQDYSAWQAGRWPEIARIISGNWLRYYLFGGAIVSGLGFTLTSMCCTSRVLAGMGTMQIFPKKISRIIGYYHPTIGTPIPAILLNATVTLVFSVSMEFGEVVALCQCLYCLRMVLVYGALVKLRIDYPNLARPFALPFGTLGCALFLLPATIFCLVATVVSATVSFAIGMALVGFLVIGSILSYLYCRFFARNGFQGVIVQCELTDEDDDDVHEDSPNGNATNTVEVNKGVFYDDGYQEKEGNMLFGILPLGNSVGEENEREMRALINNSTDNNNDINNNNSININKNNREGCEPLARSLPMGSSYGGAQSAPVFLRDIPGHVGIDDVADEKPPPASGQGREF